MAYDRRILSIDYDDDDTDYQSFDNYLRNETETQKKSIGAEIMLMGEQYLNEIDKKKAEHERKKSLLIPYIVSHSEIPYTVELLNEYSYEDVLAIYRQTKKENRSFIVKLIHFLLGLD